MGILKSLLDSLSGIEKDQLNNVQKVFIKYVSDKKIKLGSLLEYLNNDDTYKGLDPGNKIAGDDLNSLGIKTPKGYSLDY